MKLLQNCYIGVAAKTTLLGMWVSKALGDSAAICPSLKWHHKLSITVMPF